MQVKEIINKIKCEAINTTNTCQSIIASSSQNISSSVATQLPKLINIKKNIRKQRRLEKCPYPIPSCISDIIIPEKFTKTLNGDQFLYFNGCQGASKMLIFTTNTNISLIKTSQHWYLY